jgi:hypothetical protein
MRRVGGRGVYVVPVEDGPSFVAEAVSCRPTARDDVVATSRSRISGVIIKVGVTCPPQFIPPTTVCAVPDRAMLVGWYV